VIAARKRSRDGYALLCIAVQSINRVLTCCVVDKAAPPASSASSNVADRGTGGGRANLCRDDVIAFQRMFIIMGRESTPPVVMEFLMDLSYLPGKSTRITVWNKITPGLKFQSR
jgi:hypothetical protein